MIAAVGTDRYTSTMKRLCSLVCLSLALLSFHASACVPSLLLKFWDTDSSNPGPGGTAPTGTWGVDPDWSTTGAGDAPTEAWQAGQVAVFCAAGSYSIGDYTVFVNGTVQVADIHVDQGAVTFQPDPNFGGDLDLVAIDKVDSTCTSRDSRLLSVGHYSADSVATYNVVLKGANGIIRYKQGRLIFGATNTFSGSTTIEGGVLELGAPNVIPTNSALILANDDGRGDVRDIGLANNTPATFSTGGFSQRLGPLQLRGPAAAVARTIDFGNGASALAFADSSTQTWLSNESSFIPLHIINYTPGVDSLRFGTNAGGLTKRQLGQLRFEDQGGLPAKIDSNGYVTPARPVIESIRRNGS
jgi:autotransporter-associated beta strand protein